MRRFSELQFATLWKGLALAGAVIGFATSTSAGAFGTFAVCGDPKSGPCDLADGTPGCDDLACCEAVCDFSPACCTDGWDAFCVEVAVKLCGLFIYDCEDIPGAQPANDCVANSVPIELLPLTLVSFAFNTNNANTDGPDQPQCNSAEGDVPIWKDIWYHWTAEADGLFTASTCNITPFDTKIALYDLGPDLPSGIDPRTLPDLFIICNEDCADDPNFASTQATEVVTGNTYVARVGGYIQAGGPGVVEFSFAVIKPPPPPDTCDAGGTDPLTQSNSNVAEGGEVACAAGNITTANQFARSFDLGVGDTAGKDYLLNCVEFGWTNSGSLLVGAINAYSDSNGGAPTGPGVDLVLLGSRPVALDGKNFLGNLIAAFDPPICVPADTVLVIEVSIPGSTDGFAVIAGNAAGETAPTYIRSSPCGINDYASYADIGFPDSNWEMTVLGNIGCVERPKCPSDVNGDGVVDGGDYGLVLGGWGGNDPDLDISGDGFVDGADTGLLLGDWGDCL